MKVPDKIDLETGSEKKTCFKQKYKLLGMAMTGDDINFCKRNILIYIFDN